MRATPIVVDTRPAISSLVKQLADDNPDKPELEGLRAWLMANGHSIDEDRFAALMIIATRVVAFIPGAGEIFVDQVEALS